MPEVLKTETEIIEYRLGSLQEEQEYHDILAEQWHNYYAECM